MRNQGMPPPPTLGKYKSNLKPDDTSIYDQYKVEPETKDELNTLYKLFKHDDELLKIQGSSANLASESQPMPPPPVIYTGTISKFNSHTGRLDNQQSRINNEPKQLGR